MPSFGMRYPIALTILLACGSRPEPDVFGAETMPPAKAACAELDEFDPCTFGDVNGVCRDGSCVPRTDDACETPETKCQTSEIQAGWCGMWAWPDDPEPSLSCRSCAELACAGVPGCSIVGDVCQGESGTGGCPPGCCPVCY